MIASYEMHHTRHCENLGLGLVSLAGMSIYFNTHIEPELLVLN